MRWRICAQRVRFDPKTTPEMGTECTKAAVKRPRPLPLAIVLKRRKQLDASCELFQKAGLFGLPDEGVQVHGIVQQIFVAHERF